MVATPWASLTDVKNTAGVDVEPLIRNLAAQAIEMKTGLIEAVERTDLTDRDRYWLKLAVCYQAAWINAQPDYLERNAVASASQDGQSAAMGNADWLQLSSMARTCIKRLSWRGPRSLNVGRIGSGGTTRVDVNSEAYDDSLPWTPLA